MAIIYWRTAQSIFVGGQTYPYRDVLRDLGGVFDRDRKMWALPHTPPALDAVLALSRRVGGREINQAAAPAAPAPAVAPAPAPSSRAIVEGPDAAWPVPSSPRPLPSRVAAPEPAGLAVGAAHEGAVTAVSAPGLGISELYQKIALALSAEFPRAVWVVGEVHNVNQRAQGWYLQLSEAKGGSAAAGTVTVNATLWRNDAHDVMRRLGADVFQKVMAEGMKVRVLAQVSLYRDRGHVSLRIVDVDAAYTQGTLALQREALVKELKAQGLYDANRRLAMPAFPFRVGLITADESRAKSDFLDQLVVQRFPGHVIFHPAAMQGDAVAAQVVQALNALVAAGCDLVVVTRGGGSAADLRWFDQKDVALAIARAPVPVVAAIGHHDDVSVAEELAHARQKTPTAAADYVAGIFHATQQDVDRMAGQVAAILDRRMALESARGQAMATRLGRAASEAWAARQSALRDAAFRLARVGLERVNACGDATRDAGFRLARAGHEALAAQAHANKDMTYRIGRWGLAAVTARQDVTQAMAFRIGRLGLEALATRQDAVRAQAFALGRWGLDAVARRQQATREWAWRLESLSAAATTRQGDAVRALAQGLHGHARERANRGSDAALRLGFAFEQALGRAMAQQERFLQSFEAALGRADPSPWLDKGWTQLMKDGARVTSVAQLARGDEVHARLRDGLVRLRTESCSVAAPLGRAGEAAPAGTPPQPPDGGGATGQAPVPRESETGWQGETEVPP